MRLIFLPLVALLVDRCKAFRPSLVDARHHLKGTAVVHSPAQSYGLSASAVEQMHAHGCAVLYDHGDDRCDCADDLLLKWSHHAVDGDQTLLNNGDWVMIKDLQHDETKGLQGLHFTAFSKHAELATVNSLEPRHDAMLKALAVQGRKAVVNWIKTKSPFIHEQFDEKQIVMYANFPPAIYRLHIHFVYVKPVHQEAIQFETLPLKTPARVAVGQSQEASRWGESKCSTWSDGAVE